MKKEFDILHDVFFKPLIAKRKSYAGMPEFLDCVLDLGLAIEKGEPMAVIQHRLTYIPTAYKALKKQNQDKELPHDADKVTEAYENMLKALKKYSLEMK